MPRVQVKFTDYPEDVYDEWIDVGDRRLAETKPIWCEPAYRASTLHPRALVHPRLRTHIPVLPRHLPSPTPADPADPADPAVPPRPFVPMPASYKPVPLTRTRWLTTALADAATHTPRAMPAYPQARSRRERGGDQHQHKQRQRLHARARVRRRRRRVPQPDARYLASLFWVWWGPLEDGGGGYGWGTGVEDKGGGRGSWLLALGRGHGATGRPT